MLLRLIESRPQVTRNQFGAAASATIHLLLISVAAFMTTASATPEAKRERMERIHFARPQSKVHAHAEQATPPSTVKASRAPGPPHLNLAIATEIPDVNIELAAARPSDFTEGVKGGGSTEAASNELRSGPREAYDILEVDTPAAALAGANVPVYPPSLRAAGIEGRVVAQFVVDARGRAARESIRILSSSNDLFAESVRKAIEQARFAPARLGSKPVSQMVQQLFVFKLDR